MELTTSLIEQIEPSSWLVTHGDSRRGRMTRLYRIWTNMKSRCYNPTVKSYRDYGAKGISMCDEWRESYAVFRDWALQNGYDDNLTLDRVCNKNGYSPDNCKWSSLADQQKNKTSNRKITYQGRTMNMSDWAREVGLSPACLWARISNYGWSFEKAITKEKYAR